MLNAKTWKRLCLLTGIASVSLGWMTIAQATEPAKTEPAKTEQQTSSTPELASGTQANKRKDIQQPAGKAVAQFRQLLNDALESATQLNAYTATLERQVRIDGVLQEPEIIDLKLRQKPFSVFMEWRGDGKQALFVTGEYDNKILAKATQGLAALAGVWQLDVDSPKALQGCRYPITETGIAKMTQRVVDYYQKRTEPQSFACVCREETIDDRPVIVIEIEFPEPADSQYSKCKYLFDAETKLLFGVELCEWNFEGDPSGIAEKYIFRNIDPKGCKEDTHFQADNPEYALVDED